MNILNNEDPITQQYLSKIGEVIVTLNHLETMVQFATWELINASGPNNSIQNIGRRITYSLEFMEKVDLLRALIIERFGEGKDKEFIKIYKKLQKCAEIRNDIAHSVWYIQYGSKRDDLETTKINFKKAYKREKEMNFSKARTKVELDEFNDHLKLIDESSLDIIDFMLKNEHSK